MHINDYPFLLAQFKADINHRKFKPSGCGGFDVLDFSVLDVALHAIEHEAKKYATQAHKLLLIEFARNDYIQALQQFQPAFLQDAYFIFFEADLDTCVTRVYERSYHPSNRDDHFISEEMIRGYYQQENNEHLIYQLLAQYGISKKRVCIIHNTGTRKKFYEQLRHFVSSFLVRKSPDTKHASGNLNAAKEHMMAYSTPSTALQTYERPSQPIDSDASQI
ncbi:hypothetical protein KDA_14320 [Dictyobacter alpinus]|uniref:Uncharacterized protein n=2 Tax=Dictyobacter alpinus TaxID=2014873 RepID=A0A402B3M8_9CHLR|nr:hypothetical protein KDA_14320 [Dictyobacter alpinus]